MTTDIAQADQEVSVYWQPGCTSCLRLREYLADHDVPFRSVNVLETPDAAAELDALGARSIPVVVRGGRFAFAQELDDVARFLGLERASLRLEPDALAERLADLLRVAADLVEKLPEAFWEAALPGRKDRTGLDLAHHIGVIALAFREAAHGEALVFERFLERPVGAERTASAISRLLKTNSAAMSQWRNSGLAQAPETLATYYGAQPMAFVLERTTWHAAQHVRQLEAWVEACGGAPVLRLTEALKAGLPLPSQLWDLEVGALTPDTTKV
jgi:glutaredoxin